MSILKKYIKDNMVAFGSAIPNFIITFTTITFAAEILHWSGLFSTLAYVIAQGFSLQYTVFLFRKGKMKLTVNGRTHDFEGKK